MNQHLTLVGLNHRTASIALRERFALDTLCSNEKWPLAHAKNILESLILSTCNRVEILVCGKTCLQDTVMEHWAMAKNDSAAELKSCTYVYHDLEAVRHIFKVAGSLDSMILGEPQILGQLKNAYRKASGYKKTGPIINHLMHQAFSVGKRIRTETAVALNAVSVSYAAVELSRRIFGQLSSHKAMLIGAGEMAELALKHLQQSGISEIFIINRTYAKAQELASRFGGIAKPFEQLAEYLAEADIIISSTGSQKPVIGVAEIKNVLKIRKNRPIFFIDIAVPRDIDPQVNSFDNVYLYDIDDLKGVIEENLSSRKNEAIKAEHIINEETEAFMKWLNLLDVKPTILELIAQNEKNAKAELAKTLKKLGEFPEKHKIELEKMINAIVQKINHFPLTYLKHEKSHNQDMRIEYIRKIFNLDKK